MSAMAIMTGARLAYVVRKLDGEVMRTHHRWNPKTKQIEAKEVAEPAGYIVYFPKGHVLRLKDRDALRHYGLDQPAAIVNLDGLHDPKSVAGRLMRAGDDEARRGVMLDMEEQVIRLATASSGPNIMPEQYQQVEAA